MTVPTNDNREQYAGNDAATEFDYAFKVFDADDLVVVLTAADGTETTLTRGTDYSVDGVNNINGGTVTYPLSGDPLATGETLTLLREIPVLQEIDLRNQGAFYPETLEEIADRSRMIDQQHDETLGRALKQNRGGTDYDAKGRRIIDLGDAVDPQDAYTKKQSDARFAADVITKTGGLWDAKGLAIGTLADAVNDDQAVNRRTLENYVEQISAGPDLTFTSVANMQANANLYIGQHVRTLGYYAPGDGGGNDYEVVAAGTGTDDGGSFIDLTGSGLQAKGLFGRAVSLPQFGTVGDGVADDTSAFQAARTYAVSVKAALFFPAGDYLVTAVVYSVTAGSYWLDDQTTFGINPLVSVEKSRLFLSSETKDLPTPDDSETRTPIFVVVAAEGSQHANGLRANLRNNSDDNSGNTAIYANASSDANAAWSAALHGETRHGGGTNIGLSSESAAYSTSGKLYGAVINNTTAGANATHPLNGAAKAKHPASTGVLVQGTQDVDDVGNWIFGVRFSSTSINSAGYSIRDDSGGASSLWVTSLAANSTADIQLSASSNIGMLLNGTYSTGLGMRMPADVGIGFEDSGSIRQVYDGAVSRLTFVSSGQERVGMSMTATPSLWVGGQKVVAQRQAAISNSVGGDESSKINSILTALRAHGLIET